MPQGVFIGAIPICGTKRRLNMTILEAITQLRSVKPNQYDDTLLVKWLSNLDGLIYNEIIKWHEQKETEHSKLSGNIELDGNTENEKNTQYDVMKDMDTELLVKSPYDDVYINYLSAQVDFHNGEYARYNNSMVMYNMLLSAFADWYNRNNMPKHQNYIEV